MNSLRRVLSAPFPAFSVFGDTTIRCAALTAAALLAGCSQPPTVEVTPTPDPGPTEVEVERKKLADADQALATRDNEMAKLTEELTSAKAELAERDQVISKTDAQIKALQAEFEAFKKRDSVVFGELRATVRRGGPMVAMDGYQKFLRDFPTSPLVPDVEAAIAELNNESAREADRQADLFEPARRERQNLELLREGLLTPGEMAPLFRRKTRSQVITLLGKPNINFPDGAEIGYNDRGTNPATGRKGMLIVTFEDDVVSGLRVDYTGRPVNP